MRRVVLVICDGHRADFLTPEHSPEMWAASQRGRRFLNHRSVFPSVTRVSSASIATGCLPGRHGLHGNSMALDEGQGLITRDVGHPDFRDRMRRATGATLKTRTTAEYLANRGGQIVYSNVSPGAAYFQDPDGHGFVYHRDGSYGPGLAPVPDPLTVSHDIDGDLVMTERFCREILRDRRPAMAVLWLCEPDHTMHASELGSPEHLAMLRGADHCVGLVRATVDRLIEEGDDILLMMGSDHGQETVGETIYVDQLLVEAGLKASLESTDVAVAPQGFSGLVSVAQGLNGQGAKIADYLRAQPWIGRVFIEDSLVEIGLAADHGLSIAFTMRRSDVPNGFGVMGRSDLVALAADGRTKAGLGSHGGLGNWEQGPYLLAYGSGVASGSLHEGATSIMDIAPTALRHLGIAPEGMDGKPLDLS